VALRVQGEQVVSVPGVLLDTPNQQDLPPEARSAIFVAKQLGSDGDVLRDGLAGLEAVCDVKAHGVSDLCKSFLVGRTLCVASLELGTEGEVAVLIFLDDDGAAVLSYQEPPSSCLRVTQISCGGSGCGKAPRAHGP